MKTLQSNLFPIAKCDHFEKWFHSINQNELAPLPNALYYSIHSILCQWHSWSENPHLSLNFRPNTAGGKTRLAKRRGCGHKRGPERQPFQPSVSNVVWNETHQADVTSWAIDIRNEGIEKGKRANQLATTSCWLWSSYHLSRQRLDHKTTITSDVEETLHIHSS